jgi:hypothetical protein
MYMDRRLLFFPAAAVVWAQQTPPAAEEAKRALVSRVQQYYQLMLDKKYRQAEAMIAEDSKEDYYNGKKPDIRGFEITRVEMGENNTTAVVTVKAKVLLLMMGVGAQIFDIPTPTHWKIENDQWCWYIPEEAKNNTPFGKMNTGQQGEKKDLLDGKGKAPEFRALVNQVTIDKTSVYLTAEKPDETVVIQNGLPGLLTLRVDPHVQQIAGLSVTIDKLTLDSGAKATVRLHWDGKALISDVVEIAAFPINRPFDITVKAK